MGLDRRITGRRDNTYFDCNFSDCCGLLALFKTATGGHDAEEANLIGVLCDPRFESLMQSLKPPPQKASRYSWNVGINYDSTMNPAVGKLQRAIAALQPSEMVARDLQFASVSANDSAVRRAVTMICEAIGDPGLISRKGQLPQLTAGTGLEIHPNPREDPLAQPLLNPPSLQGRSLGQNFLLGILGGAVFAVALMLVFSLMQQ